MFGFCLFANTPSSSRMYIYRFFFVVLQGNRTIVVITIVSTEIRCKSISAANLPSRLFRVLILGESESFQFHVPNTYESTAGEKYTRIRIVASSTRRNIGISNACSFLGMCVVACCTAFPLYLTYLVSLFPLNFHQTRVPLQD